MIAINDIYNIVSRHRKYLRQTLNDNPSRETLAAWNLEDERLQLFREYNTKKEESDSEIIFNFSSEVKQK